MILVVIASALLSCQVTIPAPFTFWSDAQYICQPAVGGPVPWTLKAGTLPQGVALDAVTGLLSPSIGPSAPINFTIEIAGEPTPALEPSSETKETGLGVQHLELDGSTISDSFC